jgi:uncharacterized NAD(P)/FAD-binding protein YdhS
MPKKIAIIGGGFAGTMVIRQLIDQGFQGEITRFHHSDSETLGPAYRADSGDLLLNVRSQNMSAFPEDPEHFVRFLQIEHPEISHPRGFVPRSVYGNYLRSIWTETKYMAKQNLVRFDLKQEEFNHFKDFDILVLATGNELPRIPKELPKTVVESTYYQGNPWNIEFKYIHKEQALFILGNGLTMVDTVLRLRTAGFHQKIVALSTHGFNMLAHPEEELAVIPTLPEQTDLVSLVHFFNQERKKHSEAQFLMCVDALRSQFALWWQGFTSEEKRTFLKRFRHMWGTVRHRIPSAIAKKIALERASGKLEVCAGKLLSAALDEGQLIIHFQSGESISVDHFSCLINCTGPETSIEKMPNPVLQELARRKWITADNVNQGIDIHPEKLRVLGEAPMNIYAIGNLCKGTLWESTAIGELRAQAKLIAKGILSEK